MRWKRIPYGSLRIVRRFLWFPTEPLSEIDGRWLEVAYLVQKWIGTDWRDLSWSTEGAWRQFKDTGMV